MYSPHAYLLWPLKEIVKEIYGTGGNYQVSTIPLAIYCKWPIWDLN